MARLEYVSLVYTVWTISLIRQKGQEEKQIHHHMHVESEDHAETNGLHALVRAY